MWALVMRLLLVDVRHVYGMQRVSTDVGHSRRALGGLFVGGAGALVVPSQATAAEPFHVKMSLESLGDVDIEVRPDWSPLGSARFKELVEEGFYDDSRLFRVLPGYVAQFGIAGDVALNRKWLCVGCETKLRDEPRVVSNDRGTLSFAAAGANSRQTQVFFNLGNNGGLPNFLDAQGFVPFAKVTNGMDLVDKAYSGYGTVEAVSGGLGGSVNQAKAMGYGNEYLDTVFPKLTHISKARLR